MKIAFRFCIIFMALSIGCAEEAGPRKSILSRADDALAGGAVKTWTRGDLPDAGQSDAGRPARKAVRR